MKNWLDVLGGLVKTIIITGAVILGIIIIGIGILLGALIF